MLQIGYPASAVYALAKIIIEPSTHSVDIKNAFSKIVAINNPDAEIAAYKYLLSFYQIEPRRLGYIAKRLERLEAIKLEIKAHKLILEHPDVRLENQKISCKRLVRLGFRPYVFSYLNSVIKSSKTTSAQSLAASDMIKKYFK